jgi:phosphate transport system ATP-binding protein
MNDLVARRASRARSLLSRHQNLYATRCLAVEVRRRIGMVFQKPNPFPKSIYDNIAFGLRASTASRRSDIDKLVERVTARRGVVG